jgi:hypothetical protein
MKETTTSYNLWKQKDEIDFSKMNLQKGKYSQHREESIIHFIFSMD